jgi:hypothetical protein
LVQKRIILQANNSYNFTDFDNYVPENTSFTSIEDDIGKIK